MEWRFIPQPACLVETGVTQRDQFRNDEVDLYETIVRESVQNSLDATSNGHTRVEFRWCGPEDGLDEDYLKELFEEQLPHARSSGVEIDMAMFDAPRALVIEDFGTSGLTGSVTEKDDNNFSDFWRRHGRSHKSGTSRGRWGLGKLVYSSSSGVSSFLGLTVRDGDPAPYLMGQTVLDLHRHEDKEYPAHAWYADWQGEDMESWIPVPTTDDDQLGRFRKQFGITREAEPGLSIVIPFPHSTLTPECMIGVAVANYFFPILTGQLTLTFDGLAITPENIRELAHKHAKEKIPEIDRLFDFIEESWHQGKQGDLLTLKESWVEDVKLAANDFEPEELANLQERFAAGEVVGVNLPLEIKQKNPAETFQTRFQVFVQRPPSLKRGLDLYVRGGLTLPSESKFGEIKAFGVMVADEAPISAFLGDAENPAHTKWIYNAEKLRKNFVNPGPKLKVIKNSLKNFYSLLANEDEQEDRSTMARFFFLEEPDTPAHPEDKPKRTAPTPDPKPEGAKRIARIAETVEGFSIVRTKHAEEAQFPISVEVMAAYNTASGNPYKKFDPRDFDFTVSEPIKFELTKDTVSLKRTSAQTFQATITGPKFQINVKGFDLNRDLVVKMNVLEEAEAA